MPRLGQQVQDRRDKQRFGTLSGWTGPAYSQAIVARRGGGVIYIGRKFVQLRRVK